MVFKGFDTKKSGDMMLLLQPGFVELGDLYRITHGSPYNYDNHILLIWYDWKVCEGKSHRKVFTTEIVSTLYQNLRITFLQCF
ncbi:MAG: hypothetical protein ABI045_00145 [Flavobacteriales bacterium]